MDDSASADDIGIASDGRYLSLLDHLLEACQVIDFDWRYRYLNDAAVQQNRLGERDQFIGRTMMEMYPGIEATPVYAMLKTCMEVRTPGYMEVEFTFPGGTTGWFEVRCEPVAQGIFILSVDITERKNAEANLRRTEEHLRQSQKMEAIGRLAAGVAHDFNNLLTVIIIASDMLMARRPPPDPDHTTIQQIKQAGERAATLTRQLLAFSRQQVMEPRIIDLNEVVGNTEKLLRRLIGEDITLVIRTAPDLGNIKADPGQIGQVIMNLAINARDAMPQGGRLAIETEAVELGADYADTHPEVAPGRYAMLAVSDTGHGMDKATQARIFEPFFTTKAPGKGTGLGLATVFGIVRQSGGFVWVYSEPGHGSTFKIYLPLVHEDLSAPLVIDSDPVPAGDETILLVEDDEQVRAVTSLALQLAGYTVLEARHGQEAVRICEKHPGPIHLLISDVIMPDMGGGKVAAAVRALRPGIRTMYVSGYTDDAAVRHGIELAQAAFLQKPFTPDSLARKVREVLGQRKPA
ncbi:MAG: ATP-binding protein [Pseudomonadota bacterium]